MSQDNYKAAVAFVAAIIDLVGTEPDQFQFVRVNRQPFTNAQGKAFTKLFDIGKEIVKDFEQEQREGQTLENNLGDTEQESYQQYEPYEEAEEVNEEPSVVAEYTRKQLVAEMAKINPALGLIEELFQNYLRAEEQRSGAEFCPEGTCQRCDSEIADLAVKFAQRLVTEGYFGAN